MTDAFKPIVINPGVLTPVCFSEQTAGLTGLWEGNIGKGILALELRADGTASLHLIRRVRTVYHSCGWHIAGNVIELVCARNQHVSFPILSLTKDTLVLRVGIDSFDICQLHRTSVLPKPFCPGKSCKPKP